jgi:hypothetical protein
LPTIGDSSKRLYGSQFGRVLEPFPDFTAFFSRWGLVDVSKVCVKTGGKKCVKKAGQALVDRVDKDIGK